MKTTTELNSKIWYRFIKVIYVLFFILIPVLPILVIVDNNAPKFDNEKSYIKCYAGKTLGLDENNITSYEINFNDKEIRFACLTDEELGEITKSVYPNNYQNLSNEILGGLVHDKAIENLPADFISKIKITTKNYTLVSFYTNRNWLKTIGFSFLIVIITFLIFEIIKRTFYYIILGSFRPKK